jgi:hypothetical protein
LVGVYDSAAKTAQIYVNGVLEGTSTGVTAVDVTGQLRLGRSGSTWLNGEAAEIQLWNRVLSPSEAFDLSDPIKVGKVGEWHMEDVGPGPSYDASGMAHDLTFYNGASIPASGAGHVGTGLRVDGVDDYAGPDDPVLYTDQSFTLSAWVRLSNPAAYHAFMSQRSSDLLPGFDFYYGTTENEYKFKIYASSTDNNGADSSLLAVAATTPASYHHIVAVFDAQLRQMRLYVDGTLAGSRSMNAAWSPWNATGPLQIGRSQSGANGANYFSGDIDDVTVYQGAVADVTRIP